MQMRYGYCFFWLIPSILIVQTKYKILFISLKYAYDGFAEVNQCVLYYTIGLQTAAISIAKTEILTANRLGAVHGNSSRNSGTFIAPQYFSSDGFGMRETQGRVAGGDFGRCPRTDGVFPRNPSPRNLPDCLEQTVAV